MLVADNTLPNQSFQFVVSFRPDTVIFDRDGWILKQMSSTPVWVSSDVELPETFALHQNYPNPFNPGTVIRYQLPVDGLVVLKVYNLLGQEVATLVNQQQSAGYHEVFFEGRALTSGIYFYRLSVVPLAGQQNSFVQTKKMALVK